MRPKKANEVAVFDEGLAFDEDEDQDGLPKIKNVEGIQYRSMLGGINKSEFSDSSLVVHKSIKFFIEKQPGPNCIEN